MEATRADLDPFGRGPDHLQMSQDDEALSRRDLFRYGAVIGVGAVVPGCRGREGSGERVSPSAFGPLPV